MKQIIWKKFLFVVLICFLTEGNSNKAIKDIVNSTELLTDIQSTIAPPENTERDEIQQEVTDYQNFQLFKYYVYPRKYEQAAHPTTSRNITIDGIRYQNNNDFKPIFDVSGKSINRKKQLKMLNNADQLRSHYYSVSDGHNFDTGAGNMLHLVDPLFLMATLAFVAFLINSILGLVDRINLPPVVRARHGDTPNNDGDILVRIADPRRKLVDDKLLDEIETALQIAFNAFESRFITNV